MSAAIRLLKPLSYFAEKYGSPEWAFNKLFLLTSAVDGVNFIIT